MKKQKDSLSISIETGTMVRAVVIVVVTILVLSFLSSIQYALKLLFIAFFLSLALNPAVSWIAKKLRSGSRIAATGLAYVLVVVFLTGFFALIIPPLVNQTVEFVQDVPQTVQEFKNSDTALSRFVYEHGIDQEIDQFASDFSSKYSDIGQTGLATAGAVGSGIAAAITVLVLTFMMLVEGPVWIKRILAMQPKEKRERHTELLNKMYRAVTGYVNGQVIIAFIAGASAAIGLMIFSSIFNVTINVIAMAGIVTLFALLPLIGTTIGAVIVVLACLFVSVPLAIAMAVFFIVYQQIENVTIQPYIQSKSSNLTALIVFAAALIGVTFAGILGAFVAIPTAACIRILLEDHYRAQIKRADSK